MPRENKRLKEALSRVDAEIDKTTREHAELRTTMERLSERLATLQRTRAFLLGGAA
jgi:uncharacterized membrane protein